jgi:hypothetical protein
VAGQGRVDGLRVLGFALTAVMAVVGVGLLFPRLMDAAAGSDADLAATLKKTEPDHLDLWVAGFDAPLRSQHHSFSRESIPPTQGQDEATVTCTLDFTGLLGRTEVSAFSVETIQFVRDGTDWKPKDSWAPALTGVLAVLEARRRALESGDIAALRALVLPQGLLKGEAEAQDASRLRDFLGVSHRRYRIRRWLLRVEEREVQVTEEGRLTGDLPERPVDDPITHRLRLIPHNTEFFFSPTLM